MWLRSSLLLLALAALVAAAPRVRDKVRGYDTRYTIEEPVMAKTTSWISTSSTDYSVGGNWDNGVPGTADDVHVSRIATANLTTALPTSGDALSLNTFTMDRGSTVDVGTSSTPIVFIVIDTNTLSGVAHLGKGTLYYETEVGGAADAPTPAVYVDSPNSADAMFLNAVGFGVVTRLFVTSGFVRVAATARVNELYMADSRWFPNNSNGPVVELLGGGAQDIELVIQRSGTLTSTRTIDQLIKSGGHLTHNSTTEAITILQQTSGTITYKGGVTLPTVYGMGGVIDFTETSFDQIISTLVFTDDLIIRTDPGRLTITEQWAMNSPGATVPL